MARMPDTHRRAVTMALHRQWGAEPRPTDFMVHATQPGSFDDLEDTLRRPVTPQIACPLNRAFEPLELPAPAAVPKAQPAPARPSYPRLFDPVSGRSAELRPHWHRSIRRRHLRQMQGAAEWAFVGWCVGMVTARAWGWL